jgi:hypothetical protein
MQLHALLVETKVLASRVVVWMVRMQPMLSVEGGVVE